VRACRLWTNRYNGPANGDDYAYDVAVDGSNNVIVTGLPVTEQIRLRDDPIFQCGRALWTNRYHGPANGYDEARAWRRTAATT